MSDGGHYYKSQKLKILLPEGGRGGGRHEISKYFARGSISYLLSCLWQLQARNHFDTYVFLLRYFAASCKKIPKPVTVVDKY
jgi:hypothetical protein